MEIRITKNPFQAMGFW